MFTLKTVLSQYFASRSLHFFQGCGEEWQQQENILLRLHPPSSPQGNFEKLRCSLFSSAYCNPGQDRLVPHNKSFIQVDNFDWGLKIHQTAWSRQYVRGIFGQFFGEFFFVHLVSFQDNYCQTIAKGYKDNILNQLFIF